MKDTDFEHDSRAHSFWQEWQAAADRAGDVDTYLDDLIAKASPRRQGVNADEFMDMVRGREPETFSEVTSMCFTHNGIFSTDPETNESTFSVIGEIPYDDGDLVINLT